VVEATPAERTKMAAAPFDEKDIKECSRDKRIVGAKKGLHDN
jgi:hypothetical protein